jgi:hypothetical protein
LTANVLEDMKSVMVTIGTGENDNTESQLNRLSPMGIFRLWGSPRLCRQVQG